MTLFLTSSFGEPDFHEAAHRLVTQVRRLKIFDQLVIVSEKDLPEICPWALEWYGDFDIAQVPGFGYFVWKSAIANAAVNNHWGEHQSIFYLDAGCEVLPGRRSKRVFRSLIEEVERIGVLTFSTQCNEWQYSKRELINYFPDLEHPFTGVQIQGGTWAISGRIGADFARKWNSIVRLHPDVTNDEMGEQLPGFIANRNDQSVMSLTAQSLGIPQPRFYTPIPNSTFVSQIRSLRFPIWAARNRTGKSIVRLSLRILSKLLP
jgi:hypothetical protein